MSTENTEQNPELENQPNEEVPAFTVTESVDRTPDRFTYELVDEDAPEEEEEIEETPPANEEVPNEEEEEEFEEVEINEDLAWKYLKEKKGLAAETIDELLTPKEQKKYAPELEKFQEFIDKTGNKNYNDFLETQKDWSAENEDSILKQFLKLEYPDLTQKQLDRLYDKNYSIEGLDEEVDEEELTDKSIDRSVGLKKAHALLEKRKEEFMVASGAGDNIPEEFKSAKEFQDKLQEQQKLDEEAFLATRNDYVAKTENIFTKDFKGFELELGNEKIGFEKVSFKPENIQETKEKQLDIANFNKKYFDETTGALKDPQGFHTALYFAENYKEEINKAYNRGMARQLELDDKLSKNIQPENIKHLPGQEGPKITVSISKP